MPTGYTRQSAAEIVTGQTVNASSFNNEFNAIQAAMDATTGHTHDGTVGGGAPITLTTSVTGILPIANGGTNASTAAGARTNLGLGSIATQSAASVAITGGTIAGITDLAISDGGTGASDAATARTNLGLGSIATQSAASVAISGGSITGMPTPTAASDVATKVYVDNAARLIDANLAAGSTLELPSISNYNGITMAIVVFNGGTNLYDGAALFSNGRAGATLPLSSTGAIVCSNIINWATAGTDPAYAGKVVVGREAAGNRLLIWNRCPVDVAVYLDRI